MKNKIRLLGILLVLLMLVSITLGFARVEADPMYWIIIAIQFVCILFIIMGFIIKIEEGRYVQIYLVLILVAIMLQLIVEFV